jgi:hypothetical protein
MIHRLLEMLGCELRVGRGHAQVFMAQKLLNRPQIGSLPSRDASRGRGTVGSGIALPPPLDQVGDGRYPRDTMAMIYAVDPEEDSRGFEPG